MRPVLLLALLAAAPGCERRAEPVDPRTRPAAATPGALPEAFVLRYQEISGTGFEREGWEIEILQIGPEVRVQGAVRSGGTSLPVLTTMTIEDFREIWQWLRGLPWDRFEVVEDASAPETGWRRRLEIDAVLGPEERRGSRNEWTRPPVGAPWLEDLEMRFHALVLEYAAAEAERRREGEGPPDPAVGEAVREALEDLGDAAPGNLPGARPDGP